METKIFSQNGQVIINVPALAVAYTPGEAFQLVKLLKKHIKEADEHNRAERQNKKSNASTRKR